MEYALIFLPLLGSILGYISKYLNDYLPLLIPTILIFVSSILSILVFYNGIANESYGNIYGPHFDNGGYVFYIHPDWQESWAGQLQITNAEEEEYIEAIRRKHKTENDITRAHGALVPDDDVIEVQLIPEATEDESH